MEVRAAGEAVVQSRANAGRSRKEERAISLCRVVMQQPKWRQGCQSVNWSDILVPWDSSRPGAKLLTWKLATVFGTSDGKTSDADTDVCVSRKRSVSGGSGVGLWNRVGHHSMPMSRVFAW